MENLTLGKNRPHLGPLPYPSFHPACYPSPMLLDNSYTLWQRRPLVGSLGGKAHSFFWIWGARFIQKAGCGAGLPQEQ